MDPFLARTIVEALSNGINPILGTALPMDDVCANEEIQDALIEVLEHCSIESNEQYLFRIKEEKAQLKKEKATARKVRYPNAGEVWTAEQEQDLLRLHRKGYNVYHIANILKRTPSAIMTKLRTYQETPLRRGK